MWTPVLTLSLLLGVIAEPDTTESRDYDVRRLLIEIPAFPNDAPSADPAPRREALVKFVRHSTSPPLPEDAVTFNAGFLTVEADVGTLEKVDRALSELQRTDEVQINFEFRFFEVSNPDTAWPDSVEKVLVQAALDRTRSFPIDEATAIRLARSADASVDIKTLVAPRLTLFNGQTAEIEMVDLGPDGPLTVKLRSAVRKDALAIDFALTAGSTDEPTHQAEVLIATGDGLTSLLLIPPADENPNASPLVALLRPTIIRQKKGVEVDEDTFPLLKADD